MYYSFPSASANSRPVCIVDAAGGTQTRSIVRDPTRDTDRVGKLTIEIEHGSGVLRNFLDRPPIVYDGPCPSGAIETDPIATLTGIKEVILPSPAALTRKGNDERIFELVATNIEQVDDLIVGGKRASAVRTATGLIADLSSVRPSQSDGLLLYAIGGDTFPVDACWNEQTTTSETTTEVVEGKDDKLDKKTTTKKSTFGTAQQCGQVLVPAKPNLESKETVPAVARAPVHSAPSTQTKTPLNQSARSKMRNPACGSCRGCGSTKRSHNPLGNHRTVSTSFHTHHLLFCSIRGVSFSVGRGSKDRVA